MGPAFSIALVFLLAPISLEITKYFSPPNLSFRRPLLITRWPSSKFRVLVAESGRGPTFELGKSLESSLSPFEFTVFFHVTH